MNIIFVIRSLIEVNKPAIAVYNVEEMILTTGRKALTQGSIAFKQGSREIAPLNSGERFHLRAWAETEGDVECITE